MHQHIIDKSKRMLSFPTTSDNLGIIHNFIIVIIVIIHHHHPSSSPSSIIIIIIIIIVIVIVIIQHIHSSSSHIINRNRLTCQFDRNQPQPSQALQLQEHLRSPMQRAAQ
jgi:hypothetical protein